jgi:trehalose transport system substrate-binding protein
MRRIRSWLVITGVLALVLAACPADDPEPRVEPGELEGIEIVFSTHLAEEERAPVRRLIEQFQEQTGAAVEMTAIATEDLPERLRVDVEAGRPTIHLFAVDNLALHTLVDRELVQDVGDAQIPDAVLDAMIPDEFDGTQYFLPYRPNVQLTYVNRERLEAVGMDLPTTVDELHELGLAWQEEFGTGGVTIQLAEGPPAGVGVSEWVVSFGGNPVVLNDEGSIAAFEKLQEMWDDGVFPRETLLAKFDTQVDYLMGEVAYLARNWPFTSDVMHEQGLLEHFHVYEGYAGPERMAHVIGGEVLGIPAGVEGDERTAAIALAEFLMTREAQEVLVAENAWPSIRDDALAQVPEHLQETFEAIQASLEHGWYRPNVAYWDAAQDAMNEAVRRILQEGQDVRTVLDELHEDIAAAAQRAGVEYPPTD